MTSRTKNYKKSDNWF